LYTYLRGNKKNHQRATTTKINSITSNAQKARMNILRFKKAFNLHVP